MKKRIILILVTAFVLLFAFSPQTVFAESLNENIDDQLENLDLGELEEFLNGLTDEERELFGDSFFERINKILNGEVDITAAGFFSDVAKALFSSAKSMLPHFIALLAIAVLSGIINLNKSSFLSDSTKDIIFYVCMISVILLVISDFGALIKNTQNTIQKLTNLSGFMLPVIITLMIAGGGSTSAAIYNPTVAFLSGGIANIFTTVLIPLITLTAVFSVLSNLSQGFKLGKTQDFIGNAIKWIIGLSVTIFSFFMTAQGLTAANLDGISLRAAKYAITNSIPIVGSFLSGGFDLVLAGTVLIKNAVGLGAIFLVFSIMLIPIVNLIIYQLLLKLFAALIEPVGDARISGFLSSLSKSVSFLIAVLLAIGFMLFVSLTLLIVSANAFI